MKNMKIEELVENPEFSKGASVKFDENTDEIILTNEANGEEIKIICTDCDNDKFEKRESLVCSNCGKEVEDNY